MQGFYGCQITGYQDTLLADGGGGVNFQYYRCDGCQPMSCLAHSFIYK
jgi:hypothetical protein